MPYSLRGADDLPVCTPIAWEELGSAYAIVSTAKSFAERLKTHGDVFAQQLAPIAHQTLPSLDLATEMVPRPHTAVPKGHTIKAAIEILSDGKVRTADEICDEAIKLGLIPKVTTKKYVYTSLIEYITRTIGRGRKPPIVQDEQRRFRINESPDDWPDLVPTTKPSIDDVTRSLRERLEKRRPAMIRPPLKSLCAMPLHISASSRNITAVGNTQTA